MKTITFKSYGNMCLLETLKQLHVPTFYHPSSELYIATFADDQMHLYDCVRKIMAHRVAATLQVQA